jgi:hypothetical protein
VHPITIFAFAAVKVMVAAAAINVSTAIAVSLTAGTAAVTTDAEEISSAPATETIFKNLERFYG